MSDGLVTKLVWLKSGIRTGSAALVERELARMRSEEPHLHDELRGTIAWIAGGAGDAPRTEGGLKEDVECLVARLYCALRLGRLKLWQEEAGVDVPPPPGPAALADPLVREVRSLLEEGRLILAIARVRAVAGLGLKEAKDAVEAIGEEM